MPPPPNRDRLLYNDYNQLEETKRIRAHHCVEQGLYSLPKLYLFTSITSMTPMSTHQNSLNMADVLQVVHNPKTPEEAKQKTLRRLDGLEGRHAPPMKGQRSRDCASNEDRYRRSNSDGAALLQGQRARDHGQLERRVTHLDNPSEKHVNFIDEWNTNKLAGQSAKLHEPGRSPTTSIA